MTIKEKLKLLTQVKRRNDRRAQEWAACRKEQAYEKK